jgi:hypothetical protein
VGKLQRHLEGLIGVPFARAINPISKTNWEGIGVEPDVDCRLEVRTPAAKLPPERCEFEGILPANR